MHFCPLLVCICRIGDPEFLSFRLSLLWQKKDLSSLDCLCATTKSPFRGAIGEGLRNHEDRIWVDTLKDTIMGIRIQPRDIEVPENDPFRDDLLGRKESAEVLTHLVSSLEGPCVLTVDAAWGNGKTTFLNMWAQYLRNQGFPLVKFNAWETDFSEDPFVALSKELTDGLKKSGDKAMARKIEGKMQEVLFQAAPAIVRIATAGILDINPLLENEVGQALSSSAQKRLSAYQKVKESIPEFRNALQDMANGVSKSKGGRPLIVMIDELDRCRPSYAVELLEVAKHLFAVDHIVFVLAVNRSELAHSVKALYGDGFDAQGYLRRFFDVDFVLPTPDRKAFIDRMLATIQIDDYFERTKDQTAQQAVRPVRDLLHGFFHAPDLSLRRIAQAVHRLGLVFASLRSDKRSFALTAVVCLILRTIDSDLYHRFVRREASDLEVVDRMFARPETQTLRQEYAGHLFEAVIIIAAQDEALLRSKPDPISSPLQQRYNDLVDSDASDDAARERASDVIRLVGVIRKESFWPHSGIGFNESVQRIELLSASLIDEPPTEQTNS